MNKLLLLFILIFFSQIASASWTQYSGCYNGATARLQLIIDGGNDAYISWSCGSQDSDRGQVYYWSPVADEGPCDATLGEWDQSTQQCNTTPDTCADAMASSGSPSASFYQDETGRHCVLGDDNTDGIPDCLTQSGNACYSNEDTPDNVCGSINGQTVCVASLDGNNVGTSSQSPGSTSEAQDPQTTTSTSSSTSTNETTTTTTTTQTTTTTTTEAVSEATPPDVALDEGAGGYAPYTCEDGRLAADLPSCDSSLVCPQDTYLNYGVCVPVPTYTTTTETTQTTSTVTTTDSTTGEVIDETTSTSSTTTPVSNSGSGTGTGTTPGEDVPCDASIEFCGGSFPAIDNYQPDTDLTWEGIFSDFSDEITNSEIITSISNFFAYEQAEGTCPIWSADVPLLSTSFTFTFDHLCSPIIPWTVIYGVVLAVALLFAGRIALT